MSKRLIKHAQINRYFIAQMFLTRLPTPVAVQWSKHELAASAGYFPVVGLPVGIISSIAWTIGYYGWSSAMAALFAVVAAILVTGAFHEDGLADSADGLGGAFEVDKKLAIMRDSRIGTYGSVALLLAISTKIAAISLLTPDTAITTLIGAHVVARWTSLPLIYNNHYVREQGTGKPFAAEITKNQVIASSIFSVLIAALCFGFLLPVVAVAVLAGLLFAQWYSRLKLGGITGDILGAINSLTEVLVYLVIAANWTTL
ncbi:cobalamin 5'-phosphate synthase [Chromatiales bacterium (ex Bugula neritina AB1)]|nr:cobalamin 5'-phosphate synthase [Chromatiales bacterium (ex Bugula neritina AB1)]